MDPEESSDDSQSDHYGSDFYDPKKDVVENVIGLSLQDGQIPVSSNIVRAVVPVTEKSCVLKLLISYVKTEGEKIEDDIFLNRVHCSFRFQALWNFYNKTDCGIKMFEVTLNKHHCLVSLTNVKPLQGWFLFQILDQKFHKKSEVKRFVHILLDTVDRNADKELFLHKFTVDLRLHNDVLESVRQTKELGSVWIESGGEQGQEICMVCLLEHKVVVTQRLSDIINATDECFKNHEELVGVDFMWSKVMIKFGYLQEVNNKFPNLRINWDESKNVFVLKGPRDEAKTAAGAVFEILGTAQHEISEVTSALSCQFEIFTHPEMCAYVNSVIPQVGVVWLFNHSTKKIHLFAKDPKQLNGIDKTVRGCVQEKFYPVSKDHSISSQKTNKYLEELKKQHTGRLVIHPSTAGLLVTTADDIYEDVDSAIQEIISRKGGEYQEAHGPVKQDFQMFEDPTGPSQNIFLAESEVIIKVYNIPITETNVDCIVNATDKHLTNSNGVSKAIADAAGKDFQAACAEYFRLHGPLKRDEAVVLLPGSLKCKCIISIAGPVKFKREIYRGLSHLQNVVTDCLKVADGRCMKSIAFAETAGFEPHLCAEQYYRAVDRFIRETKTPLILKEIHFVDINASMTQIIQATFAKHFAPQKGMASSSGASTANVSNIQSNQDCVICMETITDPKVLPRCGHTFCKECIDEQFKYKPACPCCGAVYGKIIGSQPDGTMKIYYENYSLPGFESSKTIVIFYEFPGGKQKAEHPHPGRPYHGIKHNAFLPNNERGKLVLKLLREAFKRKLVFTIGQEDTVTWNDIHHKTNIIGGPQQYGYPDSTYLDRVMDELAVKGITAENL